MKNIFNTIKSPERNPFNRITQDTISTPEVPFESTKLGIAANTIKGILGIGSAQDNPYVKVAKDIGQGIARTVGSVGVTAGNVPTQISNKITGDNQPLPFQDQIETDQSPVTRALFGGKPIKTVQKTTADVKQFLQPYIGDKASSLTSVPLVLGSIALDLSGFGGGKSVKFAASSIPEKFFKVVAKDKNVTTQFERLVKIGMDEANAKALAPVLAETKTTSEVKNIVKNWKPVEAAVKSELPAVSKPAAPSVINPPEAVPFGASKQAIAETRPLFNTPEKAPTKAQIDEDIMKSIPEEIIKSPELPSLAKTPSKRTPDNMKIGFREKASTPMHVLDKLGLRDNYIELKNAHLDMYKESKVIRDQLKTWMKEAPTPENNVNIFKYLDGEPVQLSPIESKVANEIKTWLSTWADRLGLQPEERITNYITHIFPKDGSQGIPEEIAALIRDKIPGEVYNPFLLERLGSEGYIKDTWSALEAYAKRGVRKVHMDPALTNLKEASKKVTEDSQIQYIKNYVDRVNMRPTDFDITADNEIKKIFGNSLGPRPTRAITQSVRKTISGAKIAGSFVTFAKNLTQGVNTFAELGTKYTAIGYKDLIAKGRAGARELEENGVLLDSAAEDQVYSAVKKFAELRDKVLYTNMNASELVNRGAAYFGAKRQFLDGKTTPKDFKMALNKEKPAGYVPSEADAVQYARHISEKTQFVFGALDNPAFLSSDIAKTALQFQSFTVKQQEFLIRMIANKEWAKFARYVVSSMLLFTYIGGAFGMKTSDTFPFFKLGTPPVWQFLYEDLYKQGALGKDQYGNFLSSGQRAKVVGKSLFTNIVPGGAQIARSYEGIKTVNQGRSESKSGKKQYKVDKTPINYVRATLFGKSNLPEAKEYYKEQEEKKKKSAGRTVSGKNPFDPI